MLDANLSQWAGRTRELVTHTCAACVAGVQRVPTGIPPGGWQARMGAARRDAEPERIDRETEGPQWKESVLLTVFSWMIEQR